MSDIRRHSLAITRLDSHTVSQEGDEHFPHTLRVYYNDAETIALDQVVQLKKSLRDASDDDFWLGFCQGLSRIVDSQYAVIAKRLEDGPPLDTPGACLMALCWFWDTGHGCEGNSMNITYHAYSCPCALMKYDKVVLIPEKLNEVFPNNPNSASLALPAEAYLAIPIFVDGKCTGHFCLMWSAEALGRRKLDWGFMEMLCHAMEDLLLERLVTDAEFPESYTPAEADASAALQAASALTSFKPFARNLSHELRTPMQGILGTLDIMFANIHDAAQTQQDPEAQKLMDDLRKDIQVIQESAKRAVEASDNVVQAYALNMGFPEGDLPSPPHEETPNIEVFADRMSALRRLDSQLKPSRGLKRRRDDSEFRRMKRSASRQAESLEVSALERRGDLESVVQESEDLQHQKGYSPSMLFTAGHGVQRVNVRSLIKYVVNESLKTGGNQEAKPPRDTAEGQIIDVEVQIMRGGTRGKVVRWNVHNSVPEYILADERDTAKMVSCVFQNALKFCDSGYVNLIAAYDPQRQCLVITVRDSGPGIPEHFRSRIFKPFAREDSSTTRQNEGLGLGLLVAKGLARKLGGDLVLVSADTSGENKGSEFEMRIPIAPTYASTSPKSPSIEVSFDPEVSRSLRQESLERSLKNSQATPTARPTLQVSHDDNPIPLPGTLDLNNSAHILPNHHLHQSPPHSPSIDKFYSTKTPLGPGPLLSVTYPPMSPQTPEISAATPTINTPPARSVSMNNLQPFDRNLAVTHPLTFLVAEDNALNRRLLVNMLSKLGYNPATQIYEAFDGADAVRQVQLASQQRPNEDSHPKGPIDVILMDLWMPAMDGYEATERILSMFRPHETKTTTPVRLPPRSTSAPSLVSLSTLDKRSEDHDDSATTTRRIKDLTAPTILAITADATDGVAERAKSVGMEGFMVKPFRVKDLEMLIREGWMRRERNLEPHRQGPPP